MVMSVMVMVIVMAMSVIFPSPGVPWQMHLYAR